MFFVSARLDCWKLFSAENRRWRPPNRIYFYLSLGMIQWLHFFDQMLPNQRLLRWCYLLSVDFTALYGFARLCIFACIFLYNMYYRFGGRHIGFAVKEHLPVMLHSTVESSTTENMGISFGISFLANPYADIKVFPVFRSPSSIFSWKQLPVTLHIIQLCRASAKTWV